MAIQTCNSLDNMLRSILMIVMAEKEQELVGSQSPSSIVMGLAGCVRGIFQARILEQVAIYSRGIFPTQGLNLHLVFLALAGRFFSTFFFF